MTKTQTMNVPLTINTRAYRITTSTFFFIAGLTFSTWASRIPDIKNKLQLSDAALGLVLFALPVGQLISLPISAWLTTRLGSKKLVIISALLYPLTLLLLAVAATTWQLVLALFLFGLFANSINIAMNTQAIGVEKFYGRSIMASFHGLWSLAGFTGALAGSLFVSAGLSPLLHFSIVSIVTGLLVLAAHNTILPNDTSAAKSQPLFIKPDKRLLILGIIAFCCMMCEGAMADWGGVYFDKVVKAPAKYITLGYVAFTSTMATGRFVGDWLVTKSGVKRMLQLSGAGIFAGLMIPVLFPYLLPAIVGFLLVGFGVSSVVPIVYGLAGKSTNTSASMALAAVSTIGFLGFLVGPPVIGFIAELANLRFSFTIIAVLGLGTIMLAGKVKEK
jgi:MFS family permease